MELFTLMEQNADNRVRFETKEESNKRRAKEALARSPEERFRFFLSMIEEFSMFYPSREKTSHNDNFILQK